MDLNALFEWLASSADATVRPLLTAWLVQIGALLHLRQVYRPGQLIRLGDVRGRIREFTKTTVIVVMDGGEAHLPGRLFSDQVAHVLAAQANSDQ